VDLCSGKAGTKSHEKPVRLLVTYSILVAHTGTDRGIRLGRAEGASRPLTSVGSARPWPGAGQRGCAAHSLGGPGKGGTNDAGAEARRSVKGLPRLARGGPTTSECSVGDLLVESLSAPQPGRYPDDLGEFAPRRGVSSQEACGANEHEPLGL